MMKNTTVLILRDGGARVVIDENKAKKLIGTVAAKQHLANLFNRHVLSVGTIYGNIELGVIE